MTTRPRRKLTDILNGSDADLRDAWKNTEAARDDARVPKGDHVCHAVSGELSASRAKGTPSYKVCWQVAEGEHAGRRIFQDLWLTTAALPRTKRDLAKLGITDPVQMEAPLPQRIRARVTVVVRSDDNGTERSEVKRFEVLGMDPPPPNPYAPTDPPADPPAEMEIPF